MDFVAWFVFGVSRFCAWGFALFWWGSLLSLPAVVVVVIHFCSLLRDKCVHFSSLCSALMRLVNLILNRSVSAGLVNWIAVVMIFLRCLHQASVRAFKKKKILFCITLKVMAPSMKTTFEKKLTSYPATSRLRNLNSLRKNTRKCSG